MSLLMLKTKNLSWQDHTLNIEVMLAPLRSTLLLNKHKTLDTKYDKEKALYERQRDACLKDYVVETRLIERRRQKILNRKKELQAEARSKSALEKEQEVILQANLGANQGRSSSAPIDGRARVETPKLEEFHPTLPKLGLRHTPLFAGNPLRPRLFLETGPGVSTAAPSSCDSDVQSHLEYGADAKRQSKAPPVGTFLTGGGQQLTKRQSSQWQKGTNATPGRKETGGKSPRVAQLPSTITKTPPAAASTAAKPPVPPTSLPKATARGTTGSKQDRGVTRRIPSVTFLGLLDQDRGGNGIDDDDDDDDLRSSVVVEVKQKTVEDKVRDFLKELDSFNSRPPTACSATNDSIFSSTRSRESERAKLVANRYHNLTLDKKLLEKAFDRYCERRKQEDLLKAMKLASKMKAHIRQARNASIIPTIATFKSSRTFMKLLKRQQRRDKQSQEQHDG